MKKTDQKGFTLAELLVVVAIIAVLVAVSIPIFSSQTDKAKAATDMANVRAAKAAAVTDYLSAGKSTAAVYYYDAQSGTVTTDATLASSIQGYGKSSKAVDNATGIPNENGTAHIVCITISSDGTPSASWTTGSGSSSASTTVLSPYAVTWDTLQERIDVNGDNTINIPAGTVITEGDKTVVAYDWTGTYHIAKGTSLADVVKNNSGDFEYVTDSMITSWNSTSANKKGDVVQYNGKYYVALSTFTAYWHPAPGGDNWAEIKKN